MVEPIVAAQGKPAVASESVAASELVATVATNPDPSISDLAQHSNSASPCVCNLPPGQAESSSQTKKKHKKKKKKQQDAALTAQHDGDQGRGAAQMALQQDNEAGAGAAEEPALETTIQFVSTRAATLGPDYAQTAWWLLGMRPTISSMFPN